MSAILHRIKVLQRELNVRTSSDAATVKEVESYVNLKLTEVAESVNIGDPQVVAILALMNIAGEYLALKKLDEENRKVVNDNMHRLLRRLNTVAG